MNADFSPELRRELLDDFYTECDELLTAIRGGFDELEIRAAQGGHSEKAVETLFRNTHSLKGISAIVGLRPAELLAHAMEDVLRALTNRKLPTSPEVVDLLLAATQRIEAIVASHRLAKTIPEIQDLLTQFEALTPPPASGPASRPTLETEVEVDPMTGARSRGLHVYRAVFSPAKALEDRGVNITTIRERLGAVAEILRSAPSIRGKGIIQFEFVVGAPRPLEGLAGWAEDGVDLVAVEEAMPSSGAVEAEPAGNLPLAPSHMVRVDLARLDELMRIAGEMVIQRSKFDDRVQQLGGETGGLRELSVAMGRSLRDLRAAVSRVRMVPVGEIFSRIPFVVRDLKRGSDKAVRVVLEGTQTEVDKYVVERLKEPLLHLVRNAFVHGIESSADRLAASKPAEATITLRAKSSGEFVVIQVRDDGRGVDAAHVVQRASKLGMIVSSRPTPAELLKILCVAGFTTREEADRAAGRGVGMAVVANTIQELGGSLTLETWAGAGTQFTLKLPLTLSIADAIIVTVGNQTCAVPQTAVVEIVQLSARELRVIKNTEVAPYRGGLMPLLRLRTLFGIDAVKQDLLTVLVVNADRGAAGLAVDRVLAQREIVIRRLVDPLVRVPGISGATELGDGRPILILDPNAITQGVVRPMDSAHSVAEESALSRSS